MMSLLLNTDTVEFIRGFDIIFIKETCLKEADLGGKEFFFQNSQYIIMCKAKESGIRGKNM